MKKFINSRRSLMATLCELYLRITGFKKIYKKERATKKFIEDKRKANSKEYFLPKFNFDCRVEEEKLGALKVYILNKQQNPTKTIFYFHGGAYFKTPLKFHLSFLKRLVAGTGAEVRLVIYPKAPVYTCQQAYNLFLQYYEKYIKENAPKKLVFMGDSSGGGLALGLAQKISATDMRLPSHLFLFSPWLDVSMSNPDLAKLDKGDPMHSSLGLKILGKAWAGDLNVKHPQVSPIYGTLQREINTYLFVGTRELLYPDIIKYYESRKDSCTLFIGCGLNHVWNIFPIPEAKKARKEIFEIIR